MKHVLEFQKFSSFCWVGSCICGLKNRWHIGYNCYSFVAILRVEDIISKLGYLTLLIWLINVKNTHHILYESIYSIETNELYI